MTMWPMGTFDKTLAGIVPSYEWVNNGTVLVTLSWGLGRRRTVSVLAQEFNEKTVADLRAQTAREILEGRIS